MTINNAHQLLVVQEQESIKQVNTEIILGTDTPPRPWLSGRISSHVGWLELSLNAKWIRVSGFFWHLEQAGC